jgi:hypothetical protein
MVREFGAGPIRVDLGRHPRLEKGAQLGEQRLVFRWQGIAHTVEVAGQSPEFSVIASSRFRRPPASIPFAGLLLVG